MDVFLFFLLVLIYYLLHFFQPFRSAVNHLNHFSPPLGWFWGAEARSWLLHVVGFAVGFFKKK